MQRGIFAMDVKLRQWLTQRNGAEWCEAHDVGIRSFKDLIHDPEIRPTLKDFNHMVVTGFTKSLEQATYDRTEVLRDHDDGKEEWGQLLPMEEPADMLPFSDIEELSALIEAIEATRHWAFGLKGYGEEGDPLFYPPFLVLNGIPGCGKTMLAKAACYQLWGRRPVLFITEAALVRTLHQALASHQVDEVVQEIMDIPNLILDDYGAAALTRGSWAHGKRDEILSYRWENDRRTMITTNLTGAEITKDSPRLGSRMMDKTKAVNIGILAGDYRQKVR